MTSPGRDIRNQAAAPLRPVRLGKLNPVIEQRAGGVIHIRSAEELARYHDKLSQPLEHWAKVAPDRLFLAQRDAQGEWRKLSYAQALSDARRIGAALLRRGLSAEKPIVVLSGNDIEQA
ncbi:MAG: feruloyl-CoA synthase, partial [Pseudolabrys sp.]